MVVVGERRDIKSRDVSGVGEILRGRAGTVRKLGVSVKIAPGQGREALPCDQRVGGRTEFSEPPLAPSFQAVDAGLFDLDLDAAASPEASAEFDDGLEDESRGWVDDDDAARRYGAPAAMNIQGRHGEPDGLPRKGSCGQDQAELAWRPADDVDPGRVRDEAANPVAVAVHRNIDGRLVFGVAINPGAQFPRPVNEAQSFTRSQRSAPDPSDQHARISVVEFDLYTVRQVEDFGESRCLGEAGLRGFPFPEGGGLKKNRPLVGEAQWTGFEDDLDTRPVAGDVNRV